MSAEARQELSPRPNVDHQLAPTTMAVPACWPSSRHWSHLAITLGHSSDSDKASMVESMMTLMDNDCSRILELSVNTRSMSVGVIDGICVHLDVCVGTNDEYTTQSNRPRRCRAM